MQKIVYNLTEYLQSLLALGFLGSLKFFFLRRFVRREIRVRIRETGHDMLFRGSSADFGSIRSVFVKNEYAALLRYVRKADTIIDAGAHIGATAGYFACRFPEARIVSIEPDKDNFSLVERNTKPFKNVTALHAGLWFESVDLVVADADKPSNSLNVVPVGRRGEGTLKGVTVHEIMDRFGMEEIDLFKMDVEGAEKEIFSGNCDWLDKVRILCVELHETKNPGCAKPFFQAALQRDFHYFVFSEYVLIVREDAFREALGQ